MRWLGILFDLDGVLLDSWEAVWRSYQGAMREIKGAAVSKKEWRKYWGLALKEISVLHGHDIDKYAKAFRKLRLKYDKIYTRKVPGSDNLIKKIMSKGIRVALVTMETREEVKHVLCRFPFKHSTLVTGSDVRRGRPYPDAILLACKKLGLKPSQCLYVGDSLHDWNSAKAANCNFCGVLTGAASRKDFKKAGVKLILNDVSELGRMINERMVS